MPAITEFIESLTDIVPKITNWAKEQKYLTGTLAVFSATLTIIWEGLKNFGQGLIFVGRSIGALAAGAGFEGLTEEFNLFADKLDESRERIKNAFSDVVDILSGKLPDEVQMPVIRQEEMIIRGEVTNSWDKFRIAVYETAEASKEAGDVISRAGAKFADSFAGGIANMVATGKASFKELADSIISDITRMIVKQQIFNALSSVFGPSGGSGGATTNAANSTPTGLSLAYSAPSFALPDTSAARNLTRSADQFGNQGATVTPLKSAGSTSGQGGDTTVNVINNSGGTATVSEQPTAGGGKEITVLIENAMESAVANGRMDKVLGSNFGLRRQGY